MDWKVVVFCVSALLLAFLVLVVFILRKKVTTSQLKKHSKLFHRHNNSKISSIKIPVYDVSEIILNNTQGQQLALKRLDNISSRDKQYSEICAIGSSAFGNLVQGSMPTLSQAQTLNEIAKAAPNGLFTATAPISDLMKYKDGTIGSIRMRNGISGHSGFQEIALSSNNPAAIIGASMQAMAAFSGQYYMHQITSQLKSIDRKLDKLVGFHHDEKIGILKSINKSIIEHTSKINVDATDIIAIQRQRDKAKEIYFGYLTHLEGIDVNDVICVKKRWVNKTKEIQNLSENLDEKELGFTIQMCYHASMLVEKCSLTEISIRMKMGGQEIAIEELCDRLKSEHCESFHRRAEQYIIDTYNPILDKATEISNITENKLNHPKKIVALNIQTLIIGTLVENINNTVLNKQAKNNTKEIENLELHKKDLLEMTKSDSQIVEDIISLIESPKEILYLPSENSGEQRIFVEEISDIQYPNNR